MVNQQIHFRNQNGGEGGIEHMQWMPEEGLRHGKWEPPGLMDQVEQQVQQKQPQCQLDQTVFDCLARLGAQDELRNAIEAEENVLQCWTRSPTQMFQAASAWCCNIERPPNVLAPNNEASLSRRVSIGL